MMHEESFYDKHNKYLLTKRRNFIIRLLTIILLWTIVIVYFVTPFSKIGDVSIKGNVYLTDKQILSMAHISEKEFRIDINNQEVEKKLRAHFMIEKANSKINLFSSQISIKEKHPIGKSDGRILWTDGSFSTEPIDETLYGYLPDIKATINASFIEDFAAADNSWAILRTNKNMLIIEEKEYPLSSKKTYTVSFEENINDQNITLVFVIDKASVTSKLTLDFYLKVVEEITSNSSNIVNGVVTIGYTESNYSYWRI